ncbi:MAG: protein-disulfide reductase DsbD N-terminal domain-containing protein [Prevotellaceae bacterium]|nr:protein-disulfide reductase DsbD N-terminal domain-containing protein [Prevotellaceae bacterium]
MIKKVFSVIMMAFAICVATSAAVKKTNLRVLYVGGHSDMETMGIGAYDTAANDRSAAQRMAAWESYLKEYFTTVKAISGKDYHYTMSNDYDVTIIDGDPKPIEPRRTISENGRFSKLVYARYVPDNFDRPVITIAEEGETMGRRIGVKNDWYCLCLDAHAFGMNTKHDIFSGPYPVKLTMVDRPTPEGAKEYAATYGTPLPETTKMWRVQNKGYMTHKGFKVGMVSRPWGYADSPETEIISGGESAKSYDAIAIGRHANWLHWGFAASPADMTDEAKPVFANAVIYISKFAGQHVIARKLHEGISTRTTADDMKSRLRKETYDDYIEMLKKYDEQTRHVADSIKKIEAAGGKLTDMDRMYLQMAEHPQPKPTYEQFVQQAAGELFQQFGTDIEKYNKYYTDNRPYFYGTTSNYGLLLDDDAKSLGIANNDKRILDKAISLWEKGEDAEKAKRLLYRYTLLRYDNAQEFRAWYKKYEKKLFFTENGGWLWLVNDLDPATPGNDYSVLKYDEVDESQLARVTQATTTEEPVQLSAAVEDNGNGNKTLMVRAKIHPGYHIYSAVSEQDPYIVTTYDIDLNGKGKLVGELQKPTGRMLNTTGTVVYENEVVFKQKFTAGRDGSIKFTINYQACDDRSCLQPMSKTIETRY